MPLPIPLFPNNEKHTVGLMYRPYFRTFKTKICHVIFFPSEKKKPFIPKLSQKNSQEKPKVTKTECRSSEARCLPLSESEESEMLT